MHHVLKRVHIAILDLIFVLFKKTDQQNTSHAKYKSTNTEHIINAL